MSPSAPSNRFVTVGDFSVPFEAELARGRLEDEGIRVFVLGGMTATTLSGFGTIGVTRILRRGLEQSRTAAFLPDAFTKPRGVAVVGIFFRRDSLVNVAVWAGIGKSFIDACWKRRELLLRNLP